MRQDTKGTWNDRLDWLIKKQHSNISYVKTSTRASTTKRKHFDPLWIILFHLSFLRQSRPGRKSPTCFCALQVWLAKTLRTCHIWALTSCTVTFFIFSWLSKAWRLACLITLCSIHQVSLRKMHYKDFLYILTLVDGCHAGFKASCCSASSKPWLEWKVYTSRRTGAWQVAGTSLPTIRSSLGTFPAVALYRRNIPPSSH